MREDVRRREHDERGNRHDDEDGEDGKEEVNPGPCRREGLETLGVALEEGRSGALVSGGLARLWAELGPLVQAAPAFKRRQVELGRQGSHSSLPAVNLRARAEGCPVGVRSAKHGTMGARADGILSLVRIIMYNPRT